MKHRKIFTKDKKVSVYHSISAFKIDMDKYDLNIPIFVDFDLGGTMNGQDFTQELFEYGFKNIYLATGYLSSHFPKMPWIKEIVGKSPPF